MKNDSDSMILNVFFQVQRLVVQPLCIWTICVYGRDFNSLLSAAKDFYEFYEFIFKCKHRIVFAIDIKFIRIQRCN